MARNKPAQDDNEFLNEIAPPRESRRVMRKSKEEFGTPIRQKKESFVQQANRGINDFSPTKAQKELINKIRDNTLVFVDSEAGTGKSSAVLWHFCKEYLSDQSKKIFVVRTAVEAGDDKIGFLPLDKNTKLIPHMAAARQLLERFLGKGKVADDFEHRIFLEVPNYLLGHTLDDCLILVDEAQQMSPLTLKLILERTGVNSKIVVAGCSSQIYTTDKKRNALADAVSRFFTADKEPKYADMAYHEFDIEECHRADIVKDVIRAYRGI